MKRLPEIDAARGLALVLMTLFHAGVTMQMLGLYEFAWYAPFWVAMAHFVRGIFFWIFGVSIALSSRSFWGQGVRALQLASGAALASFGTFLIFGDDFVRFGILHFFVVAVLFTRLFKGHPTMAMGVSFVILAVIPWADFLDPWLFSPLDFVRLIPWLAVPLWGMVWGEMVYARREPTRLAILARVPVLSALGRHAFAFYLLHFPVLYFSLLGLSKILQ